jgi:hypothetical protein
VARLRQPRRDPIQGVIQHPEESPADLVSGQSQDVTRIRSAGLPDDVARQGALPPWFRLRKFSELRSARGALRERRRAFVPPRFVALQLITRAQRWPHAPRPR